MLERTAVASAALVAVELVEPAVAVVEAATAGGTTTVPVAGVASTVPSSIGW